MNLEQLPVADGMTTGGMKAKQTLMRSVRVARLPGFSAQSEAYVHTSTAISCTADQCHGQSLVRRSTPMLGILCAQPEWEFGIIGNEYKREKKNKTFIFYHLFLFFYESCQRKL